MKKSDQIVSRRSLLISTGILAAPFVAGCSSDEIEEQLAAVDTETLENASLALKGFALVSFAVGPRIVSLPAPGVRVVAVFLIVSGVATKIAVQYLDVQLRKRYVEEALTEEETRAIESDLAVKFQTENGDTETVQLGANQYPGREEEG